MRQFRARALSALAVLLGVAGVGVASIATTTSGDPGQVTAAGWAGGDRGVPEGVSAQHNETFLRDED